MAFNWGTGNLSTQSRILGPCGNDRILNTDSINPIFYSQGRHSKNFDKDSRVTFLGLKFDRLLFFGLLKMKVVFWGLKN